MSNLDRILRGEALKTTPENVYDVVANSLLKMDIVIDDGTLEGTELMKFSGKLVKIMKDKK